MRHLRAPKRKRLLAALLGLVPLAALAAVLLASARSRHADPVLKSRLDDFPSVILWAWERPEKLDFIDPREAGVAYLARTLTLRGEEVLERPRLQPLKVAPGTKLLAVVRVESDKATRPRLTAEQRALVVASASEAAAGPNVRGVQIDFDAVLSERDFYRALLFDLRRRLPERLALSITALASWCAHDDWLGGLPVDEAVPMLFRMGADERRMRAHAEAGGAWRSELCRQSVGVSTDEPFGVSPPRARRVYVFHPRAWSPEAARETILKTRR
ncbi:MAG TPA: DUF3142 domain-containing protein [Pyrinomonadaceae bacterium]|nr:DUF3142 domain-containing protein [Pyrinomonadaceae bacterium]